MNVEIYAKKPRPKRVRCLLYKLFFLVKCILKNKLIDILPASAFKLINCTKIINAESEARLE